MAIFSEHLAVLGTEVWTYGVVGDIMSSQATKGRSRVNARQLLQKAMWSVSFYADRHHPSSLPPGMRPMPLADALDILFHSEEHCIEHTSWALQKLTKKDLPSHIQVQVLQKVRQAKMPALVRSCQRATTARGKADKSARGSASRQQLEAVRDSFQAETKTEGCVFEVGPCKTEIDTQIGTVSLKSESTVNKQIWRCLPMLDPRNWGRCSPHFDAEKTYQIKCDASGRPLRDRKGELIRETAVQLGEPWQGLMRERFDGEGISVENILQIDFDMLMDGGTLKGVDMFYSLYSCEWCQLGPLSERGGLRKNAGDMKARPVDGGKSTRVTVTKRVRYKDFTPGSPGRFFDLGESLNVWASVLLCARADSEAVFNLCCEP